MLETNEQNHTDTNFKGYSIGKRTRGKTGTIRTCKNRKLSSGSPSQMQRHPPPRAAAAARRPGDHRRPRVSLGAPRQQPSPPVLDSSSEARGPPAHAFACCGFAQSPSKLCSKDGKCVCSCTVVPGESRAAHGRKKACSVSRYLLDLLPRGVRYSPQVDTFA